MAGPPGLRWRAALGHQVSQGLSGECSERRLSEEKEQESQGEGSPGLWRPQCKGPGAALALLWEEQDGGHCGRNWEPEGQEGHVEQWAGRSKGETEAQGG